MAETSNDNAHAQRADIATRFHKGQSGNPKGRPRKERAGGSPSIGASGAGATPTYLARVMIERPVQRADGVGGTRTRLTEYLADIFERADAGDLECRKYLIAYIDRGDRRRLTALRNAEKAKTPSLRRLETAAARQASLAPEVPAEKAAAEIKIIPATKPSRVSTIAVPNRKAPSVDASKYRRDPRTGELLGSDGRTLSRDEEQRLLYPDWPYVSPHLKKSDAAGFDTGRNIGAETHPVTGPNTGPITGLETGMPSPVLRPQATDSAGNSESEKNSQENPPDDPVPGERPRWRN